MGLLSILIKGLGKRSVIVEKITQKVLALQKKVPGGAQHTDIKTLFGKSKNTSTAGGASKSGSSNSIWTQNDKMLNANDAIGKEVRSMTGKEAQTFSTKAVHQGTQDIRRYQISGSLYGNIRKP